MAIEVERLIVRLVGDAKSFTSMLDKADKAVKKNIGRIEKNISAATIQTRRFFHQYAQTVKRQMTEAMPHVRKFASLLGDRTANAAKRLAIQMRAVGIQTRRLALRMRIMSRFNLPLLHAAHATKRFKIQVRAAIIQMRHLGLRIKWVGAAIARVAIKFVVFGKKVVSAMGKARRSMQSFGRSIYSAGRRLEILARGLTLYLTAPIIGAGVAIVKLGTDFEAEMAKIEGLVGVSKEQIAAWSKELLDFAPTVAQSPVALAEALYYVTSSGFKSSAESMDILKVSARASAAGLGEAADIAKVLTSALVAYEKTNLSAARAADVLTATVREGKLEADEIAKVMSRAMPFAAALGVAFEDISAQIALLSRPGETGSRAVTAIGQLLMSLTKPSEGAREALATVELEFAQLRDLAKQPGGLLNVVKLLDMAFEGNTEKIVAVIPEMRALRAVMSQLAMEGKTVDSVLQEVYNSMGMADKAFEVAAATAKFKFNAALSGLKVALIEIGETLIPMVLRVLKKLTEWLNIVVMIWKDLSKETKEAIIVFAAVVAAVGPVLIGLGLLLMSVGAIAGAFSFIVTPVGFFAVAIAALATQLIGVGNVLDWFGDRWDDLKEHIKPAVQGIKDAFAAGDLKLAVEIGLKQLELSLYTGLKPLTETWFLFLHVVEEAWIKSMSRLRRLQAETVANLSVSILTGVGYLKAIVDPVVLAGDKRYLESEKRALVNAERRYRRSPTEENKAEMERGRRRVGKAQQRYNRTKRSGGLLPDFDSGGAIDQVEKAIKAFEAKHQEARDKALKDLSGRTFGDIEGIETSLKDLRRERDRLIRKARQKAAASGPSHEKAPSAPSGFGFPKITAPRFPEFGAGGTLEGKLVKPREATRVGTLEHSQRLAEYRAGLQSRANPELKELEAIKTAVEAMVELAEKEKKDESIIQTIDPAEFEGHV